MNTCPKCGHQLAPSGKCRVIGCLAAHDTWLAERDTALERARSLEVAIEDALSVAENTVPGFDLKLSPWCDLAAAVGK